VPTPEELIWEGFVVGVTTDLGRRIELVSMDPHFHNISMGLYRQESSSGPVFLVHSYSGKQGVRERLTAVARAMTTLGGLETLPGEASRVRFPCGAGHLLAVRRVFLEACKLDPSLLVQSRPLWILDKKSGRTVTVTSQGSGAYLLTADGDEQDKASRVAAIANGLVKLGQMLGAEPAGDRVVFECGQAHDALVGLLLVRALNVRAVLREQEMAASRGILSAPSAQK
jgi:hypothetical protein